MIRAGTLLVAAAAVVAGCGSQSHHSGSRGRLQVEQVVEKGTFPPTEGALAYIQIERADGSKVAERRLSGVPNPSATVELDPGRYVLRSWQRLCNGNCGQLAPPGNRCSTGFEIRAEQRLAGTITVHYGSGCRISFD